MDAEQQVLDILKHPLVVTAIVALMIAFILEFALYRRLRATEPSSELGTFRWLAFRQLKSSTWRRRDGAARGLAFGSVALTVIAFTSLLAFMYTHDNSRADCPPVTTTARDTSLRATLTSCAADNASQIERGS